MAPETPVCQTIGFLLLDQFTLISLSCAIEPLRMANQLAGEELYRWQTLSLNGQPVWASDGVAVTPDASTRDLLSLDAVVVCGGIGIQQAVTAEHIAWLRNQARLHCRRLGAVCTGSWALALAGLLDGFQCSVHWELMASMQEAFARVTVSASVFTLDGNRFTSSGAIALLVYLVIAVSQLRMRRLLLRQNVELTFRMWLFPWLTYLVIVFICLALGVMMVTPDHRLEVSSTIGLALVISFIGLITARQHGPAVKPVALEQS